MTKFISDLPTTNPDGFLKLIFRIDPMAAIRVASAWGVPEATQQQYMAAWALMCRQTLVPRCEYCQWALLRDDPHASCDDRAWKEYFANHGVDEEHDSDPQPETDEDERVDYNTIYNRAYVHFGNHELAREAAELYPGDFI